MYLVLLACAWPAQAAEKLPPVDPAFLEYLANFGSDEEEDWALFVDDDEPAASPPPAKEPAQRDESKTEAAAKPAEKR